MKGMRVIGLSFLIALAALSVVASAANAALPEAGRCVKVTAGTGTYSNASCTIVATTEKTKKYSWTPASAGEKLTFSGAGTETFLTTVGHSTIKCINANFAGEYTGPKTASVTISFQGCTNEAEQQCQGVPLSCQPPDGLGMQREDREERPGQPAQGAAGGSLGQPQPQPLVPLHRGYLAQPREGPTSREQSLVRLADGTDASVAVLRSRRLAGRRSWVSESPRRPTAPRRRSRRGAPRSGRRAPGGSFRSARRGGR